MDTDHGTEAPARAAAQEGSRNLDRKGSRRRTTALYPWKLTLSLPASAGERVEAASEKTGVAVPELTRQAVIAGLPLVLDRERKRAKARRG